MTTSSSQIDPKASTQTGQTIQVNTVPKKVVPVVKTPSRTSIPTSQIDPKASTQNAQSIQSTQTTQRSQSSQSSSSTVPLTTVKKVTTTQSTSQAPSISQTGTLSGGIRSNLETNLDGFTIFQSNNNDLYPYVVEGMRNVKNVFLQQGFSTESLVYKEAYYRIDNQALIIIFKVEV